MSPDDQHQIPLYEDITCSYFLALTTV